MNKLAKFSPTAQCPNQTCKSWKTRVVYTIPTRHARQHKCTECHADFTTVMAEWAGANRDVCDKPIQARECITWRGERLTFAAVARLVKISSSRFKSLWAEHQGDADLIHETLLRERWHQSLPSIIARRKYEVLEVGRLKQIGAPFRWWREGARVATPAVVCWCADCGQHDVFPVATLKDETANCPTCQSRKNPWWMRLLVRHNDNDSKSGLRTGHLKQVGSTMRLPGSPAVYHCEWCDRRMVLSRKIVRQENYKKCPQCLSVGKGMEWKGERLRLSQWAKRTGIRYEVLCNRIRRGWTIDRALTTPATAKRTKGKSNGIDKHTR